jgi:hypothetical protein
MKCLKCESDEKVSTFRYDYRYTHFYQQHKVDKSTFKRKRYKDKYLRRVEASDVNEEEKFLGTNPSEKQALVYDSWNDQQPEAKGL